MTVPLDALDCDVALVGYGPAGELLANLLGARGRRVIAVERMPSVFHQPRAAHFDSEVMRILQSIGLAETVLSDTLVARGMHFVNAVGEMLVAFDLPETDSVHGWPHGFMFHQPQLEQHLRRGAARYPNVDVRLGVEVHDVVGAGDHVRVETSAGPVTTAYAIGCDGARSLVRRAMGSRIDDLGCDQPWLVLDVILGRPQDHLPPVAVQYCDPARPATFVPMPGDRRRYEIMLLPGDDPETMVETSRVMTFLEAHLDVDAIEIERAAVYTFHALLASPWRTDRLLLAGDAAHQMPPFLGQDMCAGLRDAFNLAWKLDLVLEGAADDTLLDTYESERSPHVRTIIESAVQAGAIVQTTDPVIAALRDDAFRSGAVPAPDLPRASIGPGVRDECGEPVGGLLPQVGGSDARLGPWFTLVGDIDVDPTTFPWALQRWADPPASLQAWLAQHGAVGAIVRPDRAVLGLLHGPADLVRLAAVCRGIDAAYSDLVPGSGRPQLLVVWFSRTGGARALADALIGGACDPEAGDVDVVVRRAPDADARHVRACQAFALVTPTNFGYMSGMVKDFFDRVFLACLDHTMGLPWALVVKGSTDAAGAVQSVERIVSGLRWRAIAPPLVVQGDVAPDHLAAARELGQTLSAGLDAGMF